MLHCENISHNMATRAVRGRSKNRFPITQPSAEIFPEPSDHSSDNDNDDTPAPVIISPIKTKKHPGAPSISRQSDIEVWELNDNAIISTYLACLMFPYFAK